MVIWTLHPTTRWIREFMELGPRPITTLQKKFLNPADDDQRDHGRWRKGKLCGRGRRGRWWWGCSGTGVVHEVRNFETRLHLDPLPSQGYEPNHESASPLVVPPSRTCGRTLWSIYPFCIYDACLCHLRLSASGLLSSPRVFSYISDLFSPFAEMREVTYPYPYHPPLA